MLGLAWYAGLPVMSAMSLMHTVWESIGFKRCPITCSLAFLECCVSLYFCLCVCVVCETCVGLPAKQKLRTRTHTHTHTHTYTHTYTHTHTHTYTHTYMHTHTHRERERELNGCALLHNYPGLIIIQGVAWFPGLYSASLGCGLVTIWLPQSQAID